MTDKIQIVIIDDHAIFRQGVISILNTEPDLKVIGEGVTADDATRLAAELLPDVLLLDISIPGNGLIAAEIIAHTCPVVKVVMLTASAEEDNILAAFRAGAQAYLFKGVVTQDLVGILHDVHAGIRFLPAAVAEMLISAQNRMQESPKAFHKLTMREYEILTMVAAEKTLQEIGKHFGLEIKPVKKLITNIVEKMNLQPRK